MKILEPRNNKGQRHGYWKIYYGDGILMYKGNYINGVRCEYWEFFGFYGETYYRYYREYKII